MLFNPMFSAVTAVTFVAGIFNTDRNFIDCPGVLIIWVPINLQQFQFKVLFERYISNSTIV